MPNENSLMIFVSAGPDGLWIQKDAGKVTRTLNELNKKRKEMGRWRQEHIAPMRWMSEKLFSGFGEQMEKLRGVDDEVRKWTRDLDNVLDHARDARKQGRYLDVLFWLNQINGRLQMAIDAGKELADVSDEHMDEYLSKTRHGLQPDYTKKLKPEDILDPNQKFEDHVAATIMQEIIVQGGVVSDLSRELTTWKMHRAYSKRMAELKRGIEHLFNIAKATVGHIDSTMQNMVSARAKGDIADYLAGLDKISLFQSKFEKLFRATYENKGFKAMVERMQMRQNGKPKEEAPQTVRDIPALDAATTQPAGPLPLIEPPATQPEPLGLADTQPAPTLPMATPPVGRPNPSSIPALPPAPSLKPKKQEEVMLDVSPEGEDNVYLDESKKTIQDTSPPQFDQVTMNSKSRTEMEDIILKAKYQHFFGELKKESDPYLMAAMILKFSEMIDDQDPEKSLELIAIAEGILDA